MELQTTDQRVLVRYRNRAIRAVDVAFIKSVMALHPAMGRSVLSRHLCSSWNWRQSTGALKEYACRDLLLRLEEWGFLKLPPRIRTNGRRKPVGHVLSGFEPRPIECVDLSRLVVRPVRDREERLKWRALVDRYHYLGEGVMCGEHLLYFATLPHAHGNGEDMVACLGWGAASLRNPKRDAWLGWDFEKTRTKLNFIVNNQRFLILPWVKIKNLGSRVLALNWHRLSSDWQTRYGHGIFLAETFVDVSRFRGTVYKAANWSCLGLTAGRSKRGNKIGKECGQAKAIFVYPQLAKLSFPKQ